MEPTTTPTGTTSAAEQTTPPASPSYNPLSDAVNEKNYSMPGNTFTPDQLMNDIPEPMFTPPPMDEETSFAQPDKPKEGTKKESKPFNPALNDMPESERAKSGEKLADMILVGYGKLHGVANNALKIPEKKVNRLQMGGKIDLSVPVPYNLQNDFVQLGDFIQEYNNQAEETLVLEKDFVDEVRPPLARVLAKKGYGLTDEQTLIFMFGQDILFKGMKFAAMKQQTNDILKFAMQQTEAGRRRPVQPVTQPITPPYTPPPADTSNFNDTPPPDGYVYDAPPPPPPPRSAPVIPIQDAILHEKTGMLSGQSGSLPQFGGEGKLKTIEQLKKQDERMENKNKPRTSNKKNTSTGNTVPDGTQKRKRGRPRKKLTI